MQPLRSLFVLLMGLIGGAGAAAWLLQKEPDNGVAAPPVQKASQLDVQIGAAKPSAALSAARQANLAELEQWKTRAQTVQTQLKDVEASLTALRSEMTTVQGWQAKTPALVRLGQSLARLPANKAAAADAAIAAGCFPAVSSDCQDLATIDGIGLVYEQRLYDAGVGSFWEVAHISDDGFKRMLRLSDWQHNTIDLDDIRAQARQLALDTATVGHLWEGETPDDFERINGIGKVYEQRLYAAGIRTYRALAAAKVDDLATIIGRQIVQPDLHAWISQAQALLAAKRAGGQPS